VLGMYEDITDRKMMERRLQEMAHTDSLTGLANRAFFHHQLEHTTALARRNGTTLALLYLDLDKFKAVNDTHGHEIGDRLLKAFAQRIKGVLRETDIVARLGGDEFALTVEALTDIHGRTVAVLGMYEDITDRKMMERRLQEMAHSDSLTGLANHAFFHHQLEHTTALARRNATTFALLYLDLDKFKAVNDTHGHEIGDRLLKAFAQRIKGVLREADVVARLGGDEFAVTLENLPDRSAAHAIAAKLVSAMRAPFVFDAIEITVGTSIGVAFSSPDTSAQELVRRADQAMYRAKHGGRNRFEVDAD
jgi:diguanylate cyclase (GGDEF)-like protein